MARHAGAQTSADLDRVFTELLLATLIAGVGLAASRGALLELVAAVTVDPTAELFTALDRGNSLLLRRRSTGAECDQHHDCEK